MISSFLLAGDEVSVTPYAGEGSSGPVYGTAVVVPCRAEFDRKLVRNSSGDEVVSEATLYVRPSIAGVDATALFAPESRVTVNGQRDSQVISVAPHRGSGPAVYVEVVLR